MKRKSWMLGVLFVLVILVSYMAKPEKVQSDLLLMNIELSCRRGLCANTMYRYRNGGLPFRRKDKVCHDWLQP